MRPDAVESLRAVQASIAEMLAPELQTLFAQEASMAASALLESLAAEWDTAAEDRVGDNETLRVVLRDARVALDGLGERNDSIASLVHEIDGVLGEAGDGSLAVSRLTTVNNRLRAVLETLLCFIEDIQGQRGYDALDMVRRSAYRHLRQVSVRGWAYFDVSGFRERIVKARAELSE